MSLLVTAPILVGLGGRIAFTYINPSTIPGDSVLDLIVQGLFQGVLLQYVFAEHTVFTPALAFVFIARSYLTFFYSNYKDIDTLRTTALGLLAGFAFGFLACAALDEVLGGKGVDGSVIGREERRDERRRYRSSREARKEHARAKLREVNGRDRARNRSRSRSRSNSRERHAPAYTLPATPLSIPRTPGAIPPPSQHSRIGFPVPTETSSTLTMDQMGYTGLGRLLDLELAQLRKKAAIAEADRRRCKEERKWAVAAGDRARAEQLAWQVKRYAAMAESYTREADRRIIEATRANGQHHAQSQAPSEMPIDEYDHHQHQKRTSSYEFDETQTQAQIHVVDKTTTTIVHDEHDYDGDYTRKTKGRLLSSPNPMLDFDSGYRISKALAT